MIRYNSKSVNNIILWIYIKKEYIYRLNASLLDNTRIKLIELIRGINSWYYVHK